MAPFDEIAKFGSITRMGNSLVQTDAE